MLPKNASSESRMQTILRGLDNALVRLGGVVGPPIAIRNAETELTKALAHLYRAQAARAEYGKFKNECSAALEGARRALLVLQEQAKANDGVAAAVALVDQALHELVNIPGASMEDARRLARTPDKKPVLKASIEEPQLLDVSRPVLYQSIALPLEDTLTSSDLPELPAEEAAPVASLQQLDALLKQASSKLEAVEEDEGATGEEQQDQKEAKEEPPVAASDEEAERELFGVLLKEEEVVFARARECVEDLAMFGLMRKPLLGQGWAGRDRTERRLLARIDAIISLGGEVLPRLVKLLEDRAMPDPELTWAMLFLFGSIAGDDTADELVRIARVTALDSPEMSGAIADALSLAPHPRIEGAMREWLCDPEPGRRVIAMTVLGRRRSITGVELSQAARDPDLAVVTAAARALGNSVGVDPRLIHELLHEKSEAIVGSAMEGSILQLSGLGVSGARSFVRDGCPDFAQAALLLAVAGDTRDAELFKLAAAKTSSPVLLQAIGWYGQIQLVEPLLGRLKSGGEETKSDAVNALQRITGASLTDDQPDPEYQKDDRPFLRSFAPPPLVENLSLDADAWAAWWKKHQANCKASVRYRYGRAWSPEDNLWEMENPLASRSDRWLAHLELVARTGETIPFDQDVFVARQRRQIDQWRAFWNTRKNSSGIQGAWPLRLRG